MKRVAREGTWYLFFFQAEDGIRDLTVTGVQTCALPISRVDILLLGQVDRFICCAVEPKSNRSSHLSEKKNIHACIKTLDCCSCAKWGSQIGRASCRERV